MNWITLEKLLLIILCILSFCVGIFILREQKRLEKVDSATEDENDFKLIVYMDDKKTDSL